MLIVKIFYSLILRKHTQIMWIVSHIIATIQMVDDLQLNFIWYDAILLNVSVYR